MVRLQKQVEQYGCMSIISTFFKNHPDGRVRKIMSYVMHELKDKSFCTTVPGFARVC